MHPRELLVAPDGVLRAPIRLTGFVLLTLVFVALLGAAATALGGRPPGMASGSWIFLAAVAAAHVVMLRWVDRLPWSAVGLGREHASPRALGGGLLLGMLAIALPSVALLGSGLLEVQPMPGGAAEWWRWAAFMAAFLLPAALWEELAFRGYPFAVLRGAIGVPGALAVTSVLFGLAHVGNRPGSLLPLALVSLAGVFLGGIVVRGGGLWAAWMAHFAWNWAMAALLHTDVSGFLPSPPPGYRVTDAGPDWITGGPWGPEGGIAAGLGMSAGIAYLFARRRRAET